MSDTRKQPTLYQAFPQPYQPPPQIQTEPQPYVPAQVYNVAATSIPRYPAVQPAIQNEGWFKRNQRNKPQSNSAGSVALIFISGGMNMAWGLGVSIIPITEYNTMYRIICSWFIGGIIGAVVGAFACNNISKKILSGFASFLVIICGILQVTIPNSYDAIIASRYLNGMAVGLVFPMTFVLIGEEMIKQLRGMNAASIDTMCFGCGVFTQILFTYCWNYELEKRYQVMQISGILNIIYGSLSFIIGSLFIIESPIYYLMRGDEQNAIDSLRRLQKPFTITYETYQLLEEHKLYVAESKEKTLQQNIIYGIPALLKLCFYRSFMALNFSSIVNLAFTFSSLLTSKLQTFPFVLYALARWLGPLFISFFLDIKGRKFFMICGFFFSTILTFSVGGIFNNSGSIADLDSLIAIKYILILFQFFSSISMVSSSAYLSEAFPLPVKPYYIAIVFITEMLVHIIIIRSSNINLIILSSEYFLTLGALSLVFLGVAIFFMPETKYLSLRECLQKFKQNNNFRN